MYDALLAHFGPSNWWPAKTPFEVALGAILTQNTAWVNVEKAILLLDSATGLIPDRIAALSPAELAEAVRPSGFFRQKSKKIYNFLELLDRHNGLGHGEVDAMLHCFADVTDKAMREELLAVSGIGPETADCILLYALNRPFFVVDAYTKRLLHRHALIDEMLEYQELQEFFMDALPEDVPLYNEYHALIVRVGKDFCRKTNPKCDTCPLGFLLEYEPE